MDLKQTVIGIEFGSTRIKAVMLDRNHLPIASGSYEWENKFENGYWTYSAEEIVTGFQTCYRELKKDFRETVRPRDYHDRGDWHLRHDAWVSAI